MKYIYELMELFFSSYCGHERLNPDGSGLFASLAISSVLAVCLLLKLTYQTVTIT